MLKELRIRNFALIDRLNICFDPALNILTGETGAGKTILINALNLVLGGRASTDSIRFGEDSAEVEAAFHLDAGHRIHQQLESSGYACAPGEDLIIRRVIFRSEKANRCYLNGHMVPLNILVSIGAWLVDIHGQHEHQLLLNPVGHIDILDRFGGLEEDVDQIALIFHQYQDARKKWEELIQKRAESKKEQDLLAFQREELDRAHLIPDEEKALLMQRHLLAHSARIQELSNALGRVLYESEGSVSEVLGNALSQFQELSSLDPFFKPMEEAMNSVLIQIEDMANQLMSYASKRDFSPDHLEEVEDRLDLISRLKKKYQRTFEEILQYRKEMEIRWQLLEDYDGHIQKAYEDMNGKWAGLKKQASRLSEKRRRVAHRIEEEVEAQLQDLHMTQARFVIAFSDLPDAENGPPENLTARGWDDVEFLFSANVGEAPRPVARIASGGEISRVMLAFKSSLAMADQVLTLVFDEIDTGIGGKAAVEVGQKMKKLASHRQIICITHLPQIACHATSHFLVSKKVTKGRTLTVVEHLSRQEQIKELAKMIAGDSQSNIAIQHATEILERSNPHL